MNKYFQCLLEYLFNLHWRKVFIKDDEVIGIDGKRRFAVPLTQIEAIWDATCIIPMMPWEDIDFCILLLKDGFFLIGVRTENAMGIMSQIKAFQPSLNIISIAFEQIPWRLRDHGCLGLRVFALPGMGIFPLHCLPKYTLSPHNSSEHI